MNKSYRKNVLRTIKSSLSRFLAIFAIVSLGVGFLAGLLASPIDMRLSADRYYDDIEMYDLRIVSILGLTEDDLVTVRQTAGVEAVLPVHDEDLVLLTPDGDSHTTRVHTLPSADDPAMNNIFLQSGRMPEKAGECIVIETKSFAEEQDWIGQVLTPEEDDSEENNSGLTSPLTVVGTAKTAMYLSMEQEHTTVGTGTVGLIVYTVDESMDRDIYTGFYLTLSGAKELDSFSSEYKDMADSAAEALEELGEERADIRYHEIVEEAEEELADARKEYEDKKAEAQQELADAKKELDDGEQEIKDSEETLADAKKEIDEGQQKLDDSRAEYRRQTASAQAKIDDGYAQIRRYQAQLDQGKAQIDAVRKPLEQSQKELMEGKSQLSAVKQQLDETEANLDSLDRAKAAFWRAVSALGLPSEDTSDGGTLAALSQLAVLSPEMAEQFAPLKAGLEALAAQSTDTVQARTALEAGKAEYAQKEEELNSAQAQLDAAFSELDAQSKPLEEQQAQLDEQKAQLDRSASELRQAQATAQAEFADAERELADARAQYEDGLEQLTEARQKLEDGWKEYEDGKAEADEKLTDAEKQLLDAEKQLRDLEAGQWYVFTRDGNAAYASYDSNADKIGAIATVFPAFFFLVAALVALTTMTRMVEEERQQIGTMKALGYSSGKIAAKYLLYAACASLLGSVFGLAVGLRVFPTIIINAYNIMYDIPKAITPFNLPYALFSATTAILCTMLATFSACRAELKTAPSQLMLPKAPKAGKRVFLEYITPLWKRLKFTQKVTARNLLRYKKRFFMTIIGIAGCTALLVTGFGINDSVSQIVSLQYGELNQYELMVGLKEESALDGRELQNILNDSDSIAGYLAVSQEEGQMVPKKGDPTDIVTIFVPSDVVAMSDYFRFRHRTDSEPVTFGEDSVIITEKLSERQHLKVGDGITLTNQDGKEATLTITDICENYTLHYLYLSSAAYEKAFGQTVENNLLLCKLPEGATHKDEDLLSTRLLNCRDVAAVRFTTELSESFNNSLQGIHAIILVIIISAGALAFVVLYNLTNINISERVKEIATIKVLGFYDTEVSAYIYRENAVLTLIGAAAGLVLGVFLHQFVIRTAEIDIVMFGRSVFPISYVWSAILTVCFSVLVNLVMHRRLKRISMVESMKAPE
ncbi:MAG: FtsX-like permease family protein [Acutalibacter sp.]|nr:FtsX-like permease family protein [Acutalibacter sp.]